MQWKKSSFTVKRWEANSLRITEMIELNGVPFVLENLADPDEEPATFSTLREAQAHGELLNRLNVTQQDNDRLRAELAQARGVWPEKREDSVADETALETPEEIPVRSEIAAPLPAQALKVMAEHEDCGPDGRGVPAKSPVQQDRDPWFDSIARSN